MIDKIRYDFSMEEKSVIIKSLNLLRNYLSAQDRSTDSIDEILSKLDSHKVAFDKFELGIIINALNNYRYKLKSMNESRSDVNELLLKIIDDTEKEPKKKVLSRVLTRGNGRRF